MKKEVCSSCHQPVSSMEHVIENKALLYHFCCKLCKMKLSLHNYTALHGAFYCKVHYKQLAKARGGSEEEKMVCKQQDQQQHAMLTPDLGSQSRNRYNRAEEKIVVREKLPPRSFNSHSHLSSGPPAGTRQLTIEFVSRNQVGTSWPPVKRTSAAADRNPNQSGKNEGQGTALNLQAYKTAGSRANGVTLRRPDGKPTADTAVKKKPSLLPSIIWLKEEGPGISWVKAGGGKGERGNGKKNPEFMEGKVPRVPQGSRVSEKVTVFQQSKPKLERKSGPDIPALAPVKPPAHGRFISHSEALRDTGATKWASMTAVQADGLCTTKLLPKANKLSVTPSSEGLFSEGTINPSIKRAEPLPKMNVSSPELTLSAHLNTQDQQHPECAGCDPLATHIPGEAETHSISNTGPECRAQGSLSSHQKPDTQMHPAEYDAVKDKETICLRSGSVTSYPVADSPVLMPLHQTAEQVIEDAKTECSENLMPITYEANIQGCRKDLKSNGAEVEKVKKMQSENKECYEFVECAPGHISQESKPEGKAASSAGQARRTDDQTGLQEVGSQNMYGPLVNIPQGNILIDNVKLSTGDISGSMETQLNATHTTEISPEKPSSSENTNLKSKDLDDTLRQSILPISEPLGEKLDAFSSNELADRPENHSAGNGNVDVKPQHKHESHGTASAPQGKETGNGCALKDTPAKASSLGKNPFARLFGSENKGSTSKSELAGKKKPTKSQSALVTLFGYSSRKERNQKESLTEPSPKLSEHTDNGDQQEPSQNRSSSSHSMQKPFKKEDKSDAIMQVGRAEATRQDSPQNMEYHVGDGRRESFAHFDSTEDLGSSVLLLDSGADILSNARNLNEISCLDFHDQRDLNLQTIQQDDGDCSSLMPSRESQEESPVTNESRQPPMELMVPADTSLSLSSEGNHYDTCLHKMENLGGLDDQDSKIKTGTFSTLSHLGESHKEVELPLRDRDVSDSNALLFSAGSSNLKSTSKNFPHLSGTHVQFPADSDMQNSQVKDQPSSNLISSELPSVRLCQRNEHQLLLKSSSLLLMEEDCLDIEDAHGIGDSELIQQFDLDSQLQMDRDDPFGLGLDTTQPTTDHLQTWGYNFQPMSTSTSHTSEPLHDILGTWSTEAAVPQQAATIAEESIHAPDLP